MNKKFYFFVALIAVFFWPVWAIAQEVAPVVAVLPPDVVTPPAGLEWIAPVIEFLKGIPYVGAAVIFILKWVGAIAAIATAISVLAQALLIIPEIVARWAKAPDLAAKIKEISDKVLPILKYLSIFNVQKKKLL